MHQRKILSTILCIMLCCACQNEVQQGGTFTIQGKIPGLKKGVEIGLLSEEGDRAEIATATVLEDGQFQLTGQIDHPTLCTLTTNNLTMINDEVEAGNYENVKWTYTSVMVSATDMKIEVADYNDIPDEPISDKFRIVGGQPQEDFNEWNLMKPQDQMQFIQSHPKSVVSLLLANRMLEDGYNLTAGQITQLEQTITSCPADTARYNLFVQRCSVAEHTAKGSSIVDLPLLDTEGKPHQLVDVIPQGKIVLVDFWASWCGICRAANPTIKEMVAAHPDDFAVISISSDQKDAAWRKAMEEENCSWPQYVLTEQGYKDFFQKYQTQAVPYFLLVGRDSKAICNPGGIADVRQMVDNLLK